MTAIDVPGDPPGNGYARVSDIVAIVKLATDPIAIQVQGLRDEIGRWRAEDQGSERMLREEFEACRTVSKATRERDALNAERRKGQWAAAWSVVHFVRSEWRTIGLMGGWALTTAALLAANVR